jgi:hypothetical protein
MNAEHDGVAWAKSWFQNMPQPWRKAYESMKARRNEIMDAQATAAGMNRLFEGKDVKDTVKK